VASLIVGTSEGSWSPDGEGGLHGHDVTALARGSSGPWAVVDHGSINQLSPSGEWKDLTGPHSRRINCFLPSDGGGFAGTSEAHLVELRSGVLEAVEGFERAEGRDDWYTPWGGPPDVRSLAAGSSGEFYVNVHVGGILRSDDEGASWRQTIDIGSDVHQVLAVSERPGLVLAATAAGLAMSSDGGSSWDFDRERLHSSYCRAVALCGDTVLLTAARGPYGGRAAVYRRSLDRVGFEKCEAGLPEWFGDNIDTGCLASDGETAAFGTSDGQVYLSQDAGRSWERAGERLPAVRSVLLA
jgi:hypothetical protein